MATRPEGEPRLPGHFSQEALVERTLELLSDVAGPEAAEAASVETFRGQASVRIPKEAAVDLFRRMRDADDLHFNVLMDVTCVHFPKRPPPLGAYDVVYHLVSLDRGHRLRLKIACPDPDEGVDSASPIWAGANFLEREAYDMLGLRFQGHPDLRRILMGEDYDGWPLRKDFPYRGH